MKFITEEDLRYQYKGQPFITYMLEAGSKLTPGARQFLNDKKVLIEDNPAIKTFALQNNVKQPSPQDQKQMLRQKLVLSKIKTVEAEFLAAGEELLHLDIILSQKVIVLAKQFSGLKEILLGKDSNADLSLEECTGIHQNNFHCELSDCFEITEFHMQMEKGKEIVLLHKLRCILRETDVSIAEKYLDTGSEEDDQLYHLVSGKLNQVINTLSQLICTGFGGTTCQRKM